MPGKPRGQQQYAEEEEEQQLQADEHGEDVDDVHRHGSIVGKDRLGGGPADDEADYGEEQGLKLVEVAELFTRQALAALPQPVEPAAEPRFGSELVELLKAGEGPVTTLEHCFRLTRVGMDLGEQVDNVTERGLETDFLDRGEVLRGRFFPVG